MASFDLSTSLDRARALAKVDWVRPLFIGLFHVGAVAALFHFSWTNFFIFFTLYVISGMGITTGFHRLLTHKSFKTPRWIEVLWTIAGTLALQGGPISWVADHRQHHGESDTHLDPHDIHKGFMWAHLFWMFRNYPKWYLEAHRKAYAPDMLKDPFFRWMEKYFWVPTVVVGLILLAIGGVPAVLWGIGFRLTFLYHSTWFVNSAAHKWGYRPFSHEVATNNWWVALLAFGEGWHNNHHAHPTSARHGLRAWEFDVSWISIWVMSKLGLASKIRLPRNEELPWKKPRISDGPSELSA